MTYNGVELTLQLTNATFAERYETALHKAHRAAEAAGKAEGASLAQMIRGQCAVVATFIDEVFGAGTYAALGVDPDDLTANTDLFAQIIEDSRSQRNALRKRLQQYSPARSART